LQHSYERTRKHQTLTSLNKRRQHLKPILLYTRLTN
jgi:hypothetical protein